MCLEGAGEGENISEKLIHSIQLSKHIYVFRENRKEGAHLLEGRQYVAPDGWIERNHCLPDQVQEGDSENSKNEATRKVSK